MKISTGSLRIGVVASLVTVFAPLASAAESAVPASAGVQPSGVAPLVLGAPPAWTVMALGAAVISITVARRFRKAAPARARRA